jgi:hypothetical protein
MIGIQENRSAHDMQGWDVEMKSVMARIAPQHRHMVMALARELVARHPAQPAPRTLRLVQG